jgi:CSLREA domain-containing protein
MSTTKKIYTGITLILLVGILSYGLFIVTKPAYAASIIVNSNLDGITPTDGNCTLREAIENANTDSDVSGGDCIAGSGSDVITFSGALIIAPVSPYIITSPITIDGVSGIPGLSCGDIIEATIPRVLGVGNRRYCSRRRFCF